MSHCPSPTTSTSSSSSLHSSSSTRSSFSPVSSTSGISPSSSKSSLSSPKLSLTSASSPTSSRFIHPTPSPSRPLPPFRTPSEIAVIQVTINDLRALCEKSGRTDPNDSIQVGIALAERSISVPPPPTLTETLIGNVKEKGIEIMRRVERLGFTPFGISILQAKKEGKEEVYGRPTYRTMDTKCIQKEIKTAETFWEKTLSWLGYEDHLVVSYQETTFGIMPHPPTYDDSMHYSTLASRSGRARSRPSTPSPLRRSMTTSESSCGPSASRRQRHKARRVQTTA